MNIWLLIDDKKDGPHHDFEVRSMINNNDLSENTLAWHEGMEKWLPIGEVELFKDSFQELPSQKDSIEETLHPEEETIEVVDQSNVKAYLESLAAKDKISPHRPPQKYTAEGEPVVSLYDGEIGIFLWRRLFARILDIVFLSAILFMTAIFAHQEPLKFFMKSEHFILIFCFYTFYEILCLHLFGSSIGKSILGIRIESFTGTNLGLMRATFRGLATTFIMIAFGDPIFAFILFGLCILFVKKRNMLPWDVYGASSARALPLTKNKVIAGILFYFIINLIVSLAMPPHVMEDMMQTISELQKN